MFPKPKIGQAAQERLIPYSVDYFAPFICLMILNANKTPINAPTNRNVKVKEIGL